MPSSFTLVTEAPVAAETLFDASLSIDTHVESMSASGEQAVAGVTTGQIGLGETVTWRARHFGIWFTMTSRISALERPERFVDQQVSGPFRSFRHEHLFETIECADGPRTRMTDVITLAAPVGGRVVESLILVPYLRRLIRSRNEHLVR